MQINWTYVHTYLLNINGMKQLMVVSRVIRWVMCFSTCGSHSRDKSHSAELSMHELLRNSYSSSSFHRAHEKWTIRMTFSLLWCRHWYWSDFHCFTILRTQYASPSSSLTKIHNQRGWHWEKKRFCSWKHSLWKSFILLHVQSVLKFLKQNERIKINDHEWESN